ncbi:hypothetical protein FV222_00240 [Methylobacterium sp. WL103]|nr:hypothetical protein FV222_00240 [Methylobacterium sp. WL103]
MRCKFSVEAVDHQNDGGLPRVDLEQRGEVERCLTVLVRQHDLYGGRVLNVFDLGVLLVVAEDESAGFDALPDDLSRDADIGLSALTPVLRHGVCPKCRRARLAPRPPLTPQAA